MTGEDERQVNRGQFSLGEDTTAIRKYPLAAQPVATLLLRNNERPQPLRRGRALFWSLMRALLVPCVSAVLLIASSSAADPIGFSFDPFSTGPARDPWRIEWPSGTEASAPAVPFAPLRFAPQRFDQDAGQPLHAVAVEHSNAYQTRAKIHKYASFATLPLFAAELALGQSLNGSNDSKKGAHAVVGAGIVGLFGVNTITGAWNLFGEGRQDKEGRTLRLVHGLLMMAADVGFLATTVTAPSTGQRGALTFEADRNTHRNLAIASVSVGTVGYLMMLFGNR
jgi:hypothetical protein